jgi:hypothetical protein
VGADPSSIDPTHFLHEQLAQALPDLLRSMLTTFINTLMSAEVDAVCGAGYRESSPERTNGRNGYRHREFDARAGTLWGSRSRPRHVTCGDRRRFEFGDRGARVGSVLFEELIGGEDPTAGYPGGPQPATGAPSGLR